MLPFDTWKGGLSKTVQVQPSRFKRVFTGEERDYIVCCLDMDAYYVAGAQVREGDKGRVFSRRMAFTALIHP